MKTYITSGIAALMITAGFAGAAAAQDRYSDPNGLPQSPPTIEQSRGVDRMSTGSIVRSDGLQYDGNTAGNADRDGGQDSGDYYDGAMRPHN